jgi:hypothetical protein
MSVSNMCVLYAWKFQHGRSTSNIDLNTCINHYKVAPVDRAYCYIYWCRFCFYTCTRVDESMIAMIISASIGKCWDPINRFNPATFVFLSQARHGFSNVTWVKVRGDCSFCWYCTSMACCFREVSTIFQLCRGGQFYWWRKPLTCCKSLTNFIT